MATGNFTMSRDDRFPTFGVVLERQYFDFDDEDDYIDTMDYLYEEEVEILKPLITKYEEIITEGLADETIRLGKEKLGIDIEDVNEYAVDLAYYIGKTIKFEIKEAYYEGFSITFDIDIDDLAYEVESTLGLYADELDKMYDELETFVYEEVPKILIDGFYEEAKEEGSSLELISIAAVFSSGETIYNYGK